MRVLQTQNLHGLLFTKVAKWDAIVIAFRRNHGNILPYCLHVVHGLVADNLSEPGNTNPIQWDEKGYASRVLKCLNLDTTDARSMWLH